VLFFKGLETDAGHHFIRLLKLISNRKKIGYSFLSHVFFDLL